MNEHKAKLQQADITEIETELTNLRTLLADGKIEPQVLRDGIEKVKNAAMKIGKAMYAQQSSTENQQGQSEQGQQEGEKKEGEEEKKQ